MYVLSLNYRRAEVALREQLALAPDQALTLLREIAPAVYLSTCNRCEVYGTGDPYQALSALETAVPGSGEWKTHILLYTGEKAVRHLFRVAAGLHSMVLGEDEILGQLKRAFQRSQQNGLTDYELNTVFRAAVTCAKRIKAESPRKAVSVATLAASACHSFGGRTVLLVGAGGEIGGKVLKNLASYGDLTIYASSRSGRTIPGTISVDYARRYDWADAADVLISATSSPHFTLTTAKLSAAFRTNKPRLLMDLAVPRDIDPAAAAMPGVTLRTIDDFEAMAKTNQAMREQALSSVEALLEKEMDSLRKELAFHDLMPALRLDDTMMKFIYSFRDTASGAEFESFAAVLRRMEGFS